jgi:hypothetical protein
MFTSLNAGPDALGAISLRCPLGLGPRGTLPAPIFLYNRTMPASKSALSVGCVVRALRRVLIKSR